MKDKYKFLGKSEIRYNDLILIPNQNYDNLPDNEYIRSLIAQGYFEKLNPKAKN